MVKNFLQIILLLIVFPKIAIAFTQCYYQPLFLAKNLQNYDDEITISAKKTNIKSGDIYNLEGNVELYAKDYYLRADTVDIIKSQKSIHAKNNVEMQVGGLIALATDINMQKDNNTISGSAQEIKYHYTTTGATGVFAEFDSHKNIQTLTQASYSLCPLDNPKWQIKADKIKLDKDKNRGYASGVKLEFFGIPFFYLSQYKWVLAGRESGFLHPSFSTYSTSYETGYEIDIPYYFNLAPEKDLTLTLKQLSTRGSVIDGFYRHLLANKKENGYFQSRLQFLAKNKQNDRWLIDSDFNYKTSQNTRLKIKANRVSDKLYFKEIEHDGNSTSPLYSYFNFAYNDKNLKAYVLSEKEQVVGSGTDTYVTALKLFADKTINNQYANLKASVAYTKFDHKNSNKVVGDRTHTELDTNKVFQNLSYRITPGIKLYNTNYQLNNQTNQIRTTYDASFDTKFFLERKVKLFGINLQQTLTPRMTYIYSPEKNQALLPNFDTTNINISYDNLFSRKEYIGVDRIATKNHIIAGLESDFIDYENGNTYLTLQIAQSYKVDSRDKSNVFMGATFNAHHFSLSQYLQYQPKNNAIINDSYITYKKNNSNFIRLSQHIDKEDKKSAALYSALKITDNTHIFAGINRSITEDITNYQTLGFGYESCCVAYRVAFFKKYEDNTYSSQIQFELVFKGFGSSNGRLRNKIAQDIPNYLPEL